MNQAHGVLAVVSFGHPGLVPLEVSSSGVKDLGRRPEFRPDAFEIDLVTRSCGQDCAKRRRG